MIFEEQQCFLPEEAKKLAPSEIQEEINLPGPSELKIEREREKYSNAF